METGMTFSLSRRRALARSLLAIPALAPLAQRVRAQAAPRPIDRVVDEAIGPIIEKHHVPGAAVAVTVQGKRSFFHYGVASRESGQSVTEDTIFEIGSLSKTFTATLGGLARARSALALSDKASKYLPALAGSGFDQISLLDLATYTAGGLPLQFPHDVTDQHEMITYFRHWRPVYAPGTRRLYSNVSIGLFGYLAARSMGAPFDDLLERQLFPALGLTRTYLRVPLEQMGNYAYGYANDDKPIRVRPGVLDAEAYGVKTTATDMIRFVEANMDRAGLDHTLRRSIAATHSGYDQVGDMTQGLGWEMYAYPTELEQLLAGNSVEMVLDARPVTRITPPSRPRRDVLINKTGSTNGFGAYAAFIPEKRVGIVILANRNFPVGDRVTAAYAILASLADVGQ
jgi:beta-lactamase class C